MKNIFLSFSILVFILSICSSCKKQKSPGVIARPMFRLDAAFEEYNAEIVNHNRHLLLHRIYASRLKDKGQSDEKLATTFSNDNLENRKTFAKLVVSFPDHEQIFYVPADYNPDWLFNNLAIDRDSRYEFVWIKKNLKIGEISYLVATTVEEVLFNEKNFSLEEISFADIESLKLDKISRYQQLSIAFEAKISSPSVSSFENEQKMGKQCTIGDEWARSVECKCRYQINRPINQYDHFEQYDRVNELSVELSTEGKSLLKKNGNSIELSFTEEKERFNLDLDFLNKFVSEGRRVNGRALNNECPRTPFEDLTFNHKILYNGKIELRGTRMLGGEFGKLPSEI